MIINCYGKAFMVVTYITNMLILLNIIKGYNENKNT